MTHQVNPAAQAHAWPAKAMALGTNARLDFEGNGQSQKLQEQEEAIERSNRGPVKRSGGMSEQTNDFIYSDFYSRAARAARPTQEAQQ